MKREQIISIDGQNIYTNGGRRTGIGNGDHKVGEWVWVDSGCVFGHRAPAAQLPYVPNAIEGFIEFSPALSNYQICSSGAGVPVLLQCAIKDSDWTDGWLVYDKNHFTFLYFNTGSVRIKNYINGTAVEITIPLPDSVIPEARDAYYDMNGDLRWAVFLKNDDASICKILQYKNKELISVADFSVKIKAAIDEYKKTIQEDVTAKLANYQLAANNGVITNTEYPVNNYFGGGNDPSGRVEYIFIGTCMISDFYADLTITIKPIITSVSLWDETLQIDFQPTFKSSVHNNRGDKIVISDGLAIEQINKFSGVMNRYSRSVGGKPRVLIDSSGPYSPLGYASFDLKYNYKRSIQFHSDGFEITDIIKTIEGAVDRSFHLATLAFGGMNYSLDLEKRQLLFWRKSEPVEHLHNYFLTLANGVGVTFQEQHDGKPIIKLMVEGASYDVSKQSDNQINCNIPPIVAMKNGVILYLATSNNTFWRIEKDDITSMPVGKLNNLQMPIIKIGKSKFKNLFKV